MIEIKRKNKSSYVESEVIAEFDGVPRTVGTAFTYFDEGELDENGLGPVRTSISMVSGRYLRASNLSIVRDAIFALEQEVNKYHPATDRWWSRDDLVRAGYFTS